MSPIDRHEKADREVTHGRKLEALRWEKGRLQAQYSEKYERYAGGRLLTGGTRTVWEDVPGEMAPTPALPVEIDATIAPAFQIKRDPNLRCTYYLCFGDLESPEFFRARLRFEPDDSPADVIERLQYLSQQIAKREGPDIRRQYDLFTESPTPATK